jgi:hypothetical protein
METHLLDFQRFYSAQACCVFLCWALLALHQLYAPFILDLSLRTVRTRQGTKAADETNEALNGKQI